MSRQSIRHFTDLSANVSRRTILKGMLQSAASAMQEAIAFYNTLGRLRIST